MAAEAGAMPERSTQTTFETVHLPPKASSFEVHWTHTLALAVVGRFYVPPAIHLVDSMGYAVEVELTQVEEDLWSWVADTWVPTATVKICYPFKTQSHVGGDLVLCGSTGTVTSLNPRTLARAVSHKPVMLSQQPAWTKGEAALDGAAWTWTPSCATTLELYTFVRLRVSEALTRAVAAGIMGTYDSDTRTCCVSFGTFSKSIVPYRVTRL